MRTQTTRTTKTAAAPKAAPRRTPKAPALDPALQERLDNLSLRRMRYFLFAHVVDNPRDKTVTPLITKDLYRADIEVVRAFVRTHLMHMLTERTATND